MSKSVQKQLRAARQKLNLTQKALAAQLGVPYKTLINWEQDANTPRGLALEALAGKLQALLKG